MTEFHITCTSCATRLKVNKPSLVGKILACPKCGTMLSIIVPKEQRPPNDTSAAAGPESSTIPLKRELTTNDFNEIELLLQKNDALPRALPDGVQNDPKQRFYGAGLPGMQENIGESKTERSLLAQPTRPKPGTNSASSSPGVESLKPNPPSTGKQASKGNTVPRDSVSPKAVADQNGPLLPSDRWTSPEIDRRRKMMGLLAAGLVLISVLLITAISLVNGFGKSKPGPVAKNDSSQGILDDEKEKVPDGLKESEKETAIAPADPPATEKLESDKTGDVEVKDPANIELADSGTPPPIDTSEPPPMIPGQSPEVSTDPNANPTPDTTNQQPTNSVSGDSSAKGTESVPVPLPSVKETETKNPDKRLERLSQLLEGSQINISRLKDLAASEKEENKVGVSRFLIKKNVEPLEGVDDRLKIPCESVKFEKVRLSLVLEDLMRITGIPMTLDLASVHASQGTYDPVVDLEMSKGDFGLLFDSLSASAKITMEVTEQQGIKFHSADRGELMEAKYDPPKFKLESGENSRKLTEEFVVYIQSMIEADSWKRQEDPPSILVIETDNQIKVRHNRTVQTRIVDLIEKMNGAIGLCEKPESTDFQLAVKTKSSLSEEMFSKPSKVGHRLEEPLLDVLSQLSEGTGVNIVVDWERLAPLGWRPSTLIPGNLYSETLGGFINLLTHELEITYVVIDEKTLWLTSFEGAASQTDLEVFHLGMILKGKVKDEFALNAISSLLRDEFNHPLVRVYYEKRVKSLFVIAPQSVQRKIERFLKAIVEM